MECSVGGELRGYPGLPARQMNKWVLEQMKPETPLQAEITKPKLSYFGKSQEGGETRRQPEKRTSKYKTR